MEGEDDGTYVEIKGYMSPLVYDKIADFPHKLILLKEVDLQEVFTYIKDKYGKNFINMYE